MNRRSAVKNLLVSTGVAITLPSWMISSGLADTRLFNSSFTAEEQAILAAICDTIIPAGKDIGALAVGVDKYLQKLLDDCYEPKVREDVKTQLAALQSSAKTVAGKSFAGLSPKQRLGQLQKFSVSDNKQESEFFKLMKTETIRGFTTSQQVMVNYLGYKVAPGHYYGSVDVKS